MIRKFAIILITLIIGLGATALPAGAQVGDSLYFPQTGHNVEEEFLLFYLSEPDANLVYGFPITEQFLDPLTDRIVQYFQNARFELYPNNPPGQRVALTMLGSILRIPGDARDVTQLTSNCYQDAGWQYAVCSSFLTFYQDHGGEQQFGKPVSGLEYYQGRLVQFFEYARFVYAPDNPKGANITLAPLGLAYFYLIEPNHELLEPIRNQIYNQSISQIRARAFTEKAITRNGSNQTVDIIVVDQNNAPITGALVYVTMIYPDEKIAPPIDSSATNEYGFVKISFPIRSIQVGIAQLFIRVTYNELSTLTITSFRIWY